ncbi:hypothetical protein [Brevibacterium aurantiacum]|uniref:hypothetical protein n=1 Tax=Brevibacterium aurantiacum TaxID=273384 RepID=UPI001866ED8C|nr:hypothetical protein [Brevibacterium aurantiacum]
MIDTGLLNGYVDYLERRFNRLEAKELNDPDPRRARQMDKYLTEIEAVLDLCDQIESETA